MNKSEAIRKLRIQLGEIDREYRNFSPALLENWLEEGLEQLSMATKHLRGSKVYDYADSELEKALPDDFIEVHMVLYRKPDSESFRRLSETDEHWLVERGKHFKSSGKPEYYYFKGVDEIEVWPVPEEGEVELSYVRKSVPPSEDGRLEVLGGFNSALLDFVLYKVLMRNGHPAGDRYMQLFQEHLRRAYVESNNRKSHGEMRISSIYQTEG